MISYAIHVIPQIPMERWFILILLLLAMLGGSWCYGRMRPSTGRKWGMSYGVVAYTALILWSTLLLRTSGTVHQANLIPLWSWYQGFFLSNDEICWQIYFNVLLFAPFGFFLYLGKARHLGWILLRGFLLSLFIEVCQYFFRLGLLEWDDLIHNSLGCLLGAFLAKLLQKGQHIHRLHKMNRINPGN